MSSGRRILFIDAYDSFSHNIIALLEEECGIRVTRIFIDAVIPNFEDFLLPFSAVVCGPGPGHPGCLRDVGLFKKVWTLPDDSLLPVLGICLGFQSLAHEFGASVVRLPQPRHGVKTRVTSASTSIFEGFPSIDTIQYHSLHAVLGYNIPRPSTDGHLWRPAQQCPQLEPLAWDLSSQNGSNADFNQNPSSILMAVKHIAKPFYGIQFHPESICSDPSARHIVANWWQAALSWRPKHQVEPTIMDMISPRNACEGDDASLRSTSQSTSSRASDTSSFTSSVSSTDFSETRLLSASLPIGKMTVPSICEALNLPAEDLIVLDSEMRELPQIGEASIIGLVLPDTKKIQYSVGSNEVWIQSSIWSERIDLDEYHGDIFSFLKAHLSAIVIERNDDRAFCGGLMGYISYEACLETIGIHAPTTAGRPDLCFAFVERSILIDHKHHLVHVQGLLNDNLDCDTSQWVDETCSILKKASEHATCLSEPQHLPLSDNISEKTLPQEATYKYKIAQCQDFINAGESYELCLTDQTSISLKQHTPPWTMYKHLRRLNPANFGAFVSLGPLTLLSTSPERFMKWSGFSKPSSTPNSDASADEQSSTCQFRPMKGTVRKRQERPDGSVHTLSYEAATAILSAPKERAENLMILDLIRHDLHTVCRAVSVPDLMVVEEYESVYQLISVIEGTIAKPSYFGPYEGRSGIDCLATSLPPGSMTGAPKKRSCQLLREIEGKPRSVYSGVLGYMDVSGKGDFSVLIRSIYKWDDECEGGEEKWHIGAGGAVTTLSTEEGEWEEMLTKLQSTYRLFETGSS